jgi:hypothetical protein
MLLGDWTIAESNALLRRGIFTLSTYGRVRFHHRSTQEYLTACWLRRLLDRGCQQSEVHGLIFAERYGVETVVPSLRSVAAWLAQHYPDVRDEIIRREPLMLITYGDPAALSAEAKTAVLLSLASKHAAGEIADDSVDRRALGMFGSPDLADAIHEAWNINPRPDFRADLMRLVREGRIKGCTDLAARMAGDTNAADYHRAVALEALVACEADRELRDIATAFMRNPAEKSRRRSADFAKALFPRYVTVAQLLALIDRAAPSSSGSIEGFAYIIEHLWHACPAADRPALLVGLAEICARPPFVNEYHRVAARQHQLAAHVGGIARNVLSRLGDSPPPPGLIELLAVVERARDTPRLDEDGPPLRQMVRQNPAVNRALFWHDVEEVRKNSRHVVEAYWQVHFGGTMLWQIEAADLPWLHNDLGTRALHDDRRVALSAIANLIGPGLKSEALALRTLIGKDSALRKELNSYLRRPKVSPAIRQMNEETARHEEERKAQRSRDQASWREFRDRLLSLRPRKYVSPKPCRKTMYVAPFCMSAFLSRDIRIGSTPSWPHIRRSRCL